MAGEDHAAVRQAAAGMSCRIQTSETCRGALELLRRGGISIVVCERDLPDGTWRDILDCLGPAGPCLIVTSRAADEWLWAEVLNLGGHDVLAKPFHPDEISHVLKTALLDRLPAARAGTAAWE